MCILFLGGEDAVCVPKVMSFNMWHSLFSKIYLINLSKRTDRLLTSVEQCEEYGIPFERFNAIEDREQGARGLKNSMVEIFKDAIQNQYPHILILEDDFKIVVGKQEFIDTMEKVVEQIPDVYHLIFLGCQLSARITHFHSPNLFPVTKAFSTHSVIWGLEGMKQCVESIGYPIDNWLVDNVEPLGKTYCVYPLLASQMAGFSDIGGNEIDWNPFIVPRYEQKINEFRLGMR